MSASILGIGAVTPIGRDLEKISRKLRAEVAAPPPLLRVNDELLAEGRIAKSMRRADRFIRMAAIAALDAWTRAQNSCEGIGKEEIGLIVTSGLGPHCRGFKFLDDILDSGDSNALPTDFSHSVHGAAASYIAGLLDLRGPSLTTTDFEIGFEQAILLSQTWLELGTCRRVLVGAVEELGDTQIQMASQMLMGRESISPAEGAVFLMLGGSDMKGIAQIDAGRVPEETDLLARNEPAIVPNESLANPVTAKQVVTFSPYFGHSASSSAFQLLGAMLSLRARSALGKIISRRSETASRQIVDNAITFRTSCGRSAIVRVTNSKP
jgi:hypothetical protein